MLAFFFFFTNPNAGTGLIICWQSPRQILVPNLLQAVPLCCISTSHGVVSYMWRKVGCPNRHFPDIAVVYVDEAGIYQCTVSADRSQVKSSLIDLRIKCRKFVEIILYMHIMYTFNLQDLFHQKLLMVCDSIGSLISSDIPH